MQIKNLGNTNLEDIVDCMSQSFQNYFVKIPNDVNFWANRYNAARVDYNLSFGAFDNEKLVAFIIHGIDIHNARKTAFNTGTGVLEAHRGKKLVDQIYDFAIPVLKENGITKCMLEVIDKNHRAVRVYERIGFNKDRFLRCFKGEFDVETDMHSKAQEVDIDTLKESILRFQKFYSWDHSLDAILKGGPQFKTYLVKNEFNKNIGYFILNSTNNSIAQMELLEGKDWNKIFGAIKKINPIIKINNVDDGRKSLIDAFINAGLENHINQFEMALLL